MLSVMLSGGVLGQFHTNRDRKLLTIVHSALCKTRTDQIDSLPSFLLSNILKTSIW